MPDRTRLMEMSLDLGDDKVLLERIECSESLSTPFWVWVDVLTELEVDLRPHLGKACALTVYAEDVENEVIRRFHGILIGGELQGVSTESAHLYRYRLTLQPWTYLLDQNRNMAIYQELPAPEIIRKVLNDNNISDYELRLTGDQLVRSYCVQYQESDFAFISRLMEEDGIYYFFEHKEDRHVMVICNDRRAHNEGYVAALEYNPSVSSLDSSYSSAFVTQHAYTWVEKVWSTGNAKVTLRDWRFQHPKAFTVEATDEGQHRDDTREIYHYPGDFINDHQPDLDASVVPSLELGQTRSRSMLEQTRAERIVFTCETHATSLACGTIVSISGHPAPRMNASYLIVATYHKLAADRYRSTAVSVEEEPYNVRFEAIPADTQYRPQRSTPRPIVHGIESAIVTGPAGEEIYTDEFGRVKVHFHWDRTGSADEKSTCWIRVSQSGGLGNITLPRVGHEVLVAFLGGNPDRPVVLGRVFNKEHMPIYDLPANKTRALWRTKTYGDTGRYPDAKDLDTGTPGANELRFEDKGGVEEVFLHAERDMNTRIRFDETHHVGHNQSLMIGYCRDEEVVRDESLKVGNDRMREVVHDESVKIGNDRKKDVGNDQKTTVGMNDTTEVGMTSKLTANQAVEIVVGQSSIKMDPVSVTIKAPMIKIEGSIMTEVKGLMTTVKADAILTLKGALTLIN